MPQQKHEFHLHADWDMKPVPKVVYHLAKTILDDQNALTESRTLAALVIELGTTLDAILSAVETGTLTVNLPEDVAQRIARLRRDGQLNNDDL